MKTNNLLSILAIAGSIMLSSCASKPEISNKIFVTISPLKQIVKSIVGDDFEIEVVVPQGVSPETFSPSAKQSAEIKSAMFIFQTGLLEFESTLTRKRCNPERIINLSHGISLIEGACSHCSGHGCSHGKDPHIWTSPKCLEIMAQNVFDAIQVAMPDSSKYRDNFDNLCSRLLDLDEYSREMCHMSTRKSFMIYHPAMTYFARDYDVEQIAVENEGKEPNMKRMVELIETARSMGIGKVFYQSEFPASCIESICNEIGAKPVEINPLQEDVIGFIESFATQLSE